MGLLRWDAHGEGDEKWRDSSLVLKEETIDLLMIQICSVREKKELGFGTEVQLAILDDVTRHNFG